MALTNRGGKYSSMNLRRSLTAVIFCAVAFWAGSTGAWEMEAGQTTLPTTSAGSTFQFVNFQTAFPEIPLVFVMPTMEGAEPTSVRVRNASHFGFELVQVEAPAADGPHEAMTVDWVAVTPGNHQLPDGTLLEAGTVTISDVQHGTGVIGTETWHALSFSSAFSAAPAVVLALQTAINETATIPESPPEPWLVVGAAGLTASGLNVALERCEAALGTVESAEVVAYLAIEAGVSGAFDDDSAATIAYETAITSDAIAGVDNGCNRTSFTTSFSSIPLVIGHQNRHDGGDGGWLRRCTVDTTGVEFTIDEDTHRDTERSHTAEAAGFIAFSAPFFATFGGGPVVPDISFEFATFSETEDDITHNLNVVLSETTTVDVVADFGTDDVTATAGSDYTATNGQLTIIAGQLSGQIPVDILEDLVYEGDEQFTVTLSNLQGCNAGAHLVATGTIIDDEAQPQVVFSANDYVVDEADATYPLGLILSHASASATSVDWTITDTTTTQGSDYSGTGGTVNIPALATSASISMTVLEDTEEEGDETALLDLGATSGLTLGTPNTATLTIRDNDAQATGWSMAAGTVLLPATTDGSPFQTVTFDQAFSEAPLVFAMPGSEGTDPTSVRIQNVTANGFEATQVESPNADGDHEAMTMNWVAVTPGEHTLPDGTLLEAGLVSTSAVQFGGGVTGTESWESIAFSTSFPAPPVVLAQIQTMANETAAVPGEASQPWLVVAMRNVTATGVDVALERAEVAAGTVAGPETIAYLAIDAGATESFDAIDASAVEYETFATSDALVGWGNNNCVTTSFANIYSAAPLPVGHQNRHDGGDGGWLRMCSLSTTEIGLWIDEDQYADTERNHTTEAAGVLVFSRSFHAVFGGAPPLPEIQFASSAATIAEDGGTVSLDVLLSAVAPTDVTIDYQTFDGSATAGADYVAVSDTLTILQGQTTGFIVVQISDDGLVEGDEDFTVILSNPQGADPGANMATTATITDDDVPPQPTIQFQLSGDIVDEDAGSISLDVVLSAIAPTDVIIDYQSADGTATAGSDYVAVSDTLTITQGQTTGSIEVTISDDVFAEGNETFSVLMSNPVGADPGANMSSVVTITDDDVAAPATTIAYSVGDTTNQLGAAVFIDLVDGAAAFSGDTWFFPPNDGSRITYDTDSKVGFIRSCSDDLTCEVTTPGGGVPADVSTVEVTELRAEFNSLSTALVEAGDSSHLNTYDLTAAAVSLEIACHDDVGDPDTAAVAIAGWTTDSDHGLIIRSGIASRHAGTWSDSAYRIEIADGSCITSSVGNLRIEGLQLHCSGAPTANIAGIELTGAALYGTVDVSETLIRLDNATGTGDRLGIGATNTGTVDLRIRNSVIWDLGMGSDRHVGILIEDGSVTADLANTTVVGGAYGVRQVDGLVTARNTLSTGAAVGGFAGTFEATSQRNLSDDATAPGSGSITGSAPPYVNEAAGAAADFHLECSLPRNATVTHSPFDNGTIDDVFDLNPNNPARSAAVNPAFVQLEYPQPVTVTDVSVALSHANSHRWMVAMADTAADMASMSGSYREIVPWRDALQSWPAWYEGDLANAETGAVIRLEVLKLNGDDYVHIAEWDLEFAGTPCESAVDLSSDPGIPFSMDVDTYPRIPPWDIGADESTAPGIFFSQYPNDWFEEVWESEGETVVEVFLHEPSSSDVVLAYRAEEYGAATSGVDFTAVEGTVTVPAGHAVARVTVPVIDDGQPDDQEWFRVMFAPVGAPLDSGTGIQVRIRDGQPPVRAYFTTQTVYVDEGAGQINLPVELSEIAANPVLLFWNSNDAEARMGLDFDRASNDVQIPQGQTSAVLPVTIYDDAIAEPDEVFRVTLVGANEAQVVAPAVIEIVITDNDEPSVAFTSSSYTVGESSGTATITVELVGEISGPETADWATIPGGSAIAGTDYQTGSGVLNFDPATSTQTFDITVLPDSETDGDKTVLLELSSPSSGLTLGSPAQSTLVILDDDVTPIAYVEPDSLFVAEASGAAIISVRLSEASPMTVTVDVATTPVTADEGLDFTPLSTQVTFTPGDVEEPVSVTIVDDGIPDEGETFTIGLSNPVNAVLDPGSPSFATVTIVEIPVISFAEPVIRQVESPWYALQIPVYLSQPISETVTVWFDLEEGSATGLGPDHDFDLYSGLLTFDPDQTEAFIIDNIYDDSIQEGNENFFVVLSNPSANAVLGSPDTLEVVILDDETAQAYNTRALHVEPDLIHIAWESLAAATTEVSRRDADLQDAWQLLATITDGPAFWRDSLPERGVRHEYRIFVTDAGGLTSGEDTVALAEPVPMGSDEAVVTVVPGMAAVVPGSGTAPAEAHPFAGTDDYVFSLQPDPGPTFAGCTIDVYVDEDPALADPDEPSQPVAEPFGGRARDEFECKGLAGIKVIDAQPCDGATCDVVIPGMAPGPHRLRFVLTDNSGNTSERAIVQDFHPWLATNSESLADYPEPFPYAFSSFVNTQHPSFLAQGPARLDVADSLDCADVVEEGRFESVNLVGSDYHWYWLDPDSTGQAHWTSRQDVYWLDGETYWVTFDWSGPPREYGRTILKRGSLTENWGGRQVLSDWSTKSSVSATVDLALPVDQTPLVSWVEASLTNFDTSAEISHTLWFRAEDHDHDVDPTSLTVANLTRDGGAEVFPAFYADPSSQSRPEGEYGWFVVTIPLIEGANNLSIHVEDAAGHVVDETGYSFTRYVMIPGEYPEPVISDPQPGSVFYGGYPVDFDATSSVVPTGYQVWLGALVDDGTFPMPPAFTTDQLSGSFLSSVDHAKYRLRLVIAAPGAMPPDLELRGDAQPCDLYSSGLECDATEIEITRSAVGLPGDFEVGYAFPEEVFLRWGRLPTVTVERSEDGGQGWVDLGQSPGTYYFKDTTVTEGATYHYRIRTNASHPWMYLGDTIVAPGDAIATPTWAAARIIPLLDDVTWHCPQYARRYFCDGTLHMRLQPESGQSLSEATVRVFLNEDTFEMHDGNGDVLHPDFDTGGGSLGDFVGYDAPGCVVRKATPNLEVQVPLGSEEVAVDLEGVLFGSNSLRFEVEMSNGDISERGILVALYDEPVQTQYWYTYPHFVPVLFGTRVNTTDVTFSGKGPAGRHSPDCVDGDSWYYFNNYNYDYNEALYFNKIFFAPEGERLIWTDTTGQWSSQYTGLADGTYNLQMRPALVGGWDEGSHGRVISRPEGGFYYGDLGFRISSDESSSTMGITVDSTITDLEPELGHVFDELLIDSPSTEETGTVRFRLTDADQNIDLATVRVYNCSIESCDPGQPGQVPYQGFFAEYQWDTTYGHYGWFLVDLPLSLANGGVNELRFCAEDSAVNPLGTVADPCVSAMVTRTSPTVFAVISEPASGEVDARQNEIVQLDGSTSSAPEGGVGLWSFGYYYYGWRELWVGPQVTDFEELRTSFAMLNQDVYGRLIVAASEADMPATRWPSDGSLPCIRSQGEGRCDTAEVWFDRIGCSTSPIGAVVVRDQPSSSITVGPDDAFNLSAHVSSPAYTPFVYRWLVFDASDSAMAWPVAVIGYDDDGQGFSTQNANLSISASGQGLPLGEYLLAVEAQYPASGCENPWYFGRSAAASLRVSHTLDGVAPGQVVEDAPFRVYSRTWAEGETGYVFIDEDTNNPPGEFIYSGIVQPGGYIQITPNPGDLPAIGASWYVSVGVEADGSGRSIWVNALEVRPAGSVANPLLVPAEPGGGAEIIHPVIPGETWLSTWDEPGDTDYFWFSAGAGTQVSITLDRSDLTDPPQHPDTPSPELFLARPDGVVLRASEPLGLDDTGTSIAATLTMDGAHTIAVRSSKGSGDYLLRMDITAEAGSGVPEFGFTRSRTHLMTDGGLTPSPYTTMLDPFGNPITGSWVSWEQGVECGMGDFCGNGTAIRVRSSVDGHAVLVGEAHRPDAGSDPLWRPGATLGQMLKNRPIERPGVAERLAHARSVQPILGVIQTSGREVISADLPDLRTAKEITAKAQVGARAREEMLLKGGDNCVPQSATCPGDSAPVFRVAKLDLPAGHELVDLEVRIVETDQVGRPLNGSEVLTDIPLRLEVDAHMLDDIGQPYTDTSLIDQPVALVLSEDGGGALSDGVTTCSHLATPPGDFTYWNSSRAALHYAYDEPDGSPCCYLPTELILASVTVYFEVDDGFGTMVPVSMEAAKIAQSTPRPADPCEIRPWPPGVLDGTPLIAGSGAHPLDAGESSTFEWAFSAYAIDACGNLNHLKPTDPPITATLLSPVDPEVWAETVRTEYLWEWYVLLRSTHCITPPCDPASDSYYVPDGLYDIQVSVPSTCGGGTYDQSVDLAAERPRIRLIWAQTGPEPEPPMASPGSALRNPSTGEVIAWRVKPGDHGFTTPLGQTIYTDIPVRLYVAETLIWFDNDGNVTESFRKVDDAEICVGQVHWHYDPAAFPDPSWDVRTTTCDQVFTGETTVLAYTEPEYPSGYFDGYIGVAAGVTKVPDQGGRYMLMAEPLDERFRRGDAWRIEMNVRMTVGQSYSNSGTSKKEFLVGGGLYLDENMRPFEDGILVGTSRQIHVMLYADETVDPLPATVSFVEDGVATSSAEVSLARVGSTSSGSSIYVGPVELVTPAGAALKNKALSTPVTVIGMGTLAAAYSGEDVLHHLASEVWVEVEGIYAQDDDGRDDNLLGQALDVKKDGPLWIRYRVNGTEQHIDHQSTSFEFSYDETNPVLAGFYGGAAPYVISELDDAYPDVLINGLYESEWEGRDNTGDERVLLEGTYSADATVHVAQQGEQLVLKARQPFAVEINKPHASNYGQLYPDPPYGVRDCTDPAEFADTAVSAMIDGTSFETITAPENLYATSTDVIERMSTDDAVFTFSGHAAPGILGFYGSPDNTYDPALETAIASHPGIPTSSVTEYIDAQPADAFKDIYFVVLLACNTGLPSDPADNLSHNLIGKGVDLSIAFPGDVQDDLGNTWSEVFWDWLTQYEDIPGGPTSNLYNCCHLASDHVLATYPGYPQSLLDTFDNVQIYVDSGVSSTESFPPARFGNASN